MHPVDRAAALLFRFGPKRWKVFRDGWGDEGLIELLSVNDHEPPPPPLAIEWGAVERQEDRTITDGTFPSPAPSLPESARLARLRLIEPAEPDGRLVVMMAAWNDHGYRTRASLADLLVAHGVTSVVLENPFYGSRREHDDPSIRTVADFAAMGRGAVQEGRALLSHFAADYRVGVTGYSMGGNIAALIGALMEEPVAIAALAASHSPGPVWVDGILADMVDWEALGGRSNGAVERLRRELTRASVLEVPARPHTASAIIVGARADGYIPPAAIEELHHHWPGSELRWLPGGHATMIWRQKEALVQAVVDSFDRAIDST